MTCQAVLFIMSQMEGGRCEIFFKGKQVEGKEKVNVDAFALSDFDELTLDGGDYKLRQLTCVS